MREPIQSRREVSFSHTNGFPTWLDKLGYSILLTTYQAGKLVVLRGVDRKLNLSFHNVEQAMGLAVSQDAISIASRGTIWNLRSAPMIAQQMSKKSGHDACYLARDAHVCDSIDPHEIVWGKGGLWVVNTKFSCLSTLEGEYSFVPRWQPPFISDLQAEDRCHLNGVAMANGMPAYVTMMSETDAAEGWRDHKLDGGMVMDVQQCTTVVRGLSMPHSPRIYQNRLFVLDSGRGTLGVVDRPGPEGRLIPISMQPGFTRGLAFIGPYALVGLSKIRESNIFGGLPIASHSQELKCALAVIDLRNGKKVEHFEFTSGVDELFDVQVIPNCRNPFIGGPNAHADQTSVVWAVPRLDDIPPLNHEDGAPPEPSIVLAQSPIHDGHTSPESLHHFVEGLDAIKSQRYSEAVQSFRQATLGSPAMADAHCNLGVALQLNGDLVDSTKSLERSIELQPKMPAAHFNLALTTLLARDWQRGWQEYEWRWGCAEFGKKPAGIMQMAPAWQGEPLTEKRILVYGEQGIGDEVMFYSCLRDLIDRAGQVLLSCEPRLGPTLRRSFPEAIIFESHRLGEERYRARLGAVDFQVAVGSLPLHLQRTTESFPEHRGYLVPDPTRRAFWDQILSGGGPRIGISWRGGMKTDRLNRSTQLDQWSEVFAALDATWVSLQYGDHRKELAEVSRKYQIPIIDPVQIDPLCELDDFFALMSTLDLVVSVDNSTVHFAGALGLPTLAIVAFPSTSHWRWGIDGESTVWYPSLELVRKTPKNTWDDVLATVAQKIRDFQGN